MSCPKNLVLIRTWSKQYAKKRQKGKSFSYIYTSALDWSDTVFNIKSKCGVGFQCPHPVIGSPELARRVL